MGFGDLGERWVFKGVAVGVLRKKKEGKVAYEQLVRLGKERGSEGQELGV